MSYLRQAAKGIGWHTFFKYGTALLTMVKISILARLLTPAEFGLFSLATIALGVAEAATQTGVNITIMQSRHSVQYFLDSAWVIAILRGVLIGIVMMIMGLGLQRYFHEPRLLFLVGLLSLVPVIKGFINPMIVVLYKEMRFFHDSMYRLSLSLVEAAAAVGLGILLQSAYALVGGMLVAALFEVILTFLIFAHRPRFNYLQSRGKQILSNAKWLSLSALLSYLSENLDNFLVGSLTGTYALGLYHNAYALSHKPNYEIAQAVHHGTFPILSKKVREKSRVTQAFTKSLLFLGTVALFASVPVFLFPEILIQIVLGDQWLTAAHLLPWLVGAGLIQALTTYMYTLFLAAKQYRVMNIHLGVSLVTMVGCMYILGSWWGITGTVIGLFLSRLFALPLATYGTYFTLKNQPT